jgi:hypothetical protein
MRAQVLLVALTIAAGSTLALRSSYISSSTQSRAYVLKYCRVQCEENAAKPRKPYCRTFEKALAGNFQALSTIFTDQSYHTNDIEWTTIPWHILQVIGDSRYADFVLSRPVSQRSRLLALQSPYVVAEEQASFEAFFRKHFRRTYALWASDGTVDVKHKESNRDLSR